MKAWNIILTVLIVISFALVAVQSQSLSVAKSNFENELKSREESIRKDFTEETTGLKKVVFATASEELEKYKDSVVTIKCEPKPGFGWSGSITGNGIVVEIDKQKYILTLYHIFSSMGKIPFADVQKIIQVSLLSEGVWERNLEWSGNPNAELVVIKLPKDYKYSAIPLGDSNNLKLGQGIYIIGSPWSEGIEIREGIVSSLKATPKTLDFLKKNADLYGENDIMMMSYPGVGGDSGGPIMTLDADKKLKVVGIHIGSRGEIISDKMIPLISLGLKINPYLEHARVLIKKF